MVIFKESINKICALTFHPVRIGPVKGQLSSNNNNNDNDNLVQKRIISMITADYYSQIDLVGFLQYRVEKLVAWPGIGP